MPRLESGPLRFDGLRFIARDIDWDAAPTQLLDGDLSSLDVVLAGRLRELAAQPEVLLWADDLKVEPLILIVAALAHSQRHRSRTAERIVRKVFGDTPPAWIDELEAAVAGFMGANGHAGP